MSRLALTLHVFRSAALLLCIFFCALEVRAQTTFVQDSFSGTTGTLLESHTPDAGGSWTRVRGRGLIIDANTARPDKTEASDYYTNAATPPSAEYAIGMSIRFTTNRIENYAELYARVSGTSYYSVSINALNNYTLIRTVSGVSTTLASGTTSAMNALGSTNDFELHVTNSSKRLIINGTVVATTTDNTITSAGIVGLGLSIKTKDDAIADNFYATSLSPTAVEMDSMHATRDGNRALLTWTTGRQTNNLGYRVWRDQTLLTPTPIAGSMFFANTATLNSGTSYRWIDDATTPNARYWIEELDASGAHTMHGPIVATSGTFDARALPTPKLSAIANGVIAQRSHFASNAVEVASNATNFDLANRNALKISVTSPGIQQIAIPNGVDRERLRLFEDGREIPIALTDDAIRFYGTPLNTPTSGTRVYWLTWDDGVGARIAMQPTSDAPLSNATSFVATAELRDKRIFDATLVSEDGDGFFGPVITTDDTQPARQIVRLESIDRNAATAEVVLTLQGATDTQHLIAVMLNGNAIGEVVFDARNKQRATLTVPTSALVDGDNELLFVARNGVDDVSTIESVRITYARRYVVVDGTLLFTAPGNTRVRVEGVNARSIAFDITDPSSPTQLAIDNDSIAIAGAGTRTIFVTSTMQSPSIEANAPSQLHEIASGAFVMIAPRAFLAALEPLAARRENAVLAAIEDVYDEFSFGAKDPSAIRAFIAATRPRAVLLAGDGTYDPRDYVGGGALDFVPVHFVESALQRTPSDTWYADFDDDGVADIGIGRLPARNLDELQSMIAKIIAYERDPAPARDVLTVTGSGGFAMSRALEIENNGDAIDIDEQGLAAARATLLQRWTTGVGVIDFSGHGSVAMWQSGGFFGSDDAATLTNTKLPVVIAMTCLNGYFHDIAQQSLAETLLRNSDGGAVGVWALSTLTDTKGQKPADEALLAALANNATFGEATRAAQLATTDADVRRTLLLFGDPTMKMRTSSGATTKRRAVR